MVRFKLCSQCGVPRRITKSNVWLSNGRIVERKNPDRNLIFFENNIILGVIANIEEMLGMSISRIVMEAERKRACDYIDHFTPDLVKKIARRIPYDLTANSLQGQARAMGFGDIEPLGYNLRHNGERFYRLGVRNVWFKDAFAGIIAGSLEALQGVSVAVTTEETSPGIIEFAATLSDVPPSFLEHVPDLIYGNKPGDTGLQFCPVCGGPKHLGGYKWQTDDGTIISQANGERMILIGPGEFEAIFRELESELGEDIPRVIVEAQRKYARSGRMSGFPGDNEGLRREIALRGLGNFRDMEFSDGKLKIRIENPCLVLLLVGTSQGLFELRTGSDSQVAWSVENDGDLAIEITPK